MTKRSVYHVPVANLDRLGAKLKKLDARAKRAGVAPVDWRVHGTYTKTVADWNRIDPITGEPTKRLIDFAHVTVVERPVKIAGWTFAATIEHAGEAGNVLRTVPGFDAPIPKVYRDSDPWCDHCGLKRRRNDTYVVTHDDGTWKEVGSSCLADFLGTNPGHAVAMATYARSVKTAMDEEEWGGGGRHADLGWDSRSFLALASRAINTYGWVSRGRAKNDWSVVATADVAGGMYEDWWFHRRDNKGRLLVPDGPTDAELAVADETLEWARALEGDLNDYLHNVKVVAASATVGPRGTGILASAIPAMNRDKERAIKAAAYRKRAAASEYIGTVGKPLTFTGEVVMIRELDGNYGVSYLTKFVEGDGNTVVWFASRALDRGKTYTLTATVKAHRDYDGNKETVVTRGRNIKEVK